MIDIKIIREQPELVKEALRKKACDPTLLPQIQKVDSERRTLRQELESKLAEQNRYNGEMPKLDAAKKAELAPKLKELSNQIKEEKTRLSELDDQFTILMRQIPNIPEDDVPDGASDKENVVLRQVGEKPKFSFAPKDHEELALSLDLLEMERAVKFSGSKAYFLKNELVILEQSVMRFALDILKAKGFTIMNVPDLVRADALYGCGHFASPEDAENGDIYHLKRDDLYLAGTAEVALANFHAGELLTEAQLPMRYAGISTCFRREAGTYGKETRGLYRVHQFQKVEMFSYTRPEDSKDEHSMLLSVAEDLLQKLGLCYQVVLNCGGDLGLPQAKKWDIETWMPGMNKFGETHSCSNDTDYQARSLNIRFRRSSKSGDGDIEYLHTLNNTGLASPRILIAILENYQHEDGSVEVPEVLIPYTGFSRLELRD